MLPPSHVAYTWLALSLAQDRLDVAHDVDYRMVALAAMGPDLIDKPLAAAYFYRRHKSAVLFGHTLLAFLGATLLTLRSFPGLWIYGAAFVGHAILDRIWHYPDTFYWPFRGWKFHTWGKRGSEQEQIASAYWVAFTRRPELWGWELGGMVALALFASRHRLYDWRNLRTFVLSGRVPPRS
jgi:hypothetical protein